MLDIRRTVLAIVTMLCALSGVVRAQDEPGFEPPASWVSELGARTDHQGDTVVLRRGAIRTSRLYADFILRFEFRLPQPDARGQLLVRSRFGYGATPGDVRAYKIALTNQREGTDALGRVTTAQFKMPGATPAAMPLLRAAGEWQECEFRAERATAAVRVNGELVTTLQGLEEFAGYLAFQSTGGSAIELRHLRVRRLPSAREPFGENGYLSSESGIELPRALERAKPFYPLEPYRRGIQGTVGLEVVVESTGQVGDVRVTKSLHPDLDEAAIASARQWRFKPGTKSGQPVNVIVQMEVAFKRP